MNTPQTSPVDPSPSGDEETHEPTQTRFPGHWRCSCGSAEFVRPVVSDDPDDWDVDRWTEMSR